MTPLTEIEQRRVRSALRILRARLGNWAAVAKTLRSLPRTVRTVVKEGGPVNADLAFRVARLADVPIGDLLTGKFPPPGTCPHCGRSAESPAFTDDDDETFVE